MPELVSNDRSEPQSYTARIWAHSARSPESIAIRWTPDGEESTTVTFRQLCRAADRLALRLVEFGATEESMVGFALPNGVAFFVALLAIWRIGACPTPLKPDMTPAEREPLLRMIRSPVLIVRRDFGPGPIISEAEIDELVRAEISGKATGSESAEQLPHTVPRRCWAIASGGSTGLPKIILNQRPASMAWQFVAMDKSGALDNQLVCLPLYHTSALSMAVKTLLDGGSLVVLPRFNAGQVVAAVERFQISLLNLVSATMVRLARHPGITREGMLSLRTIIVGGGAFPQSLLREWGELIDLEKIIFGYGASEGHGSCFITGAAMLERPGSVGKPERCDIKILDDGGENLPSGQVGEIWARNHSGDSQAFDYLGGDVPRKRPDGFVSVGDVGWVDADGYLYISDRRTDMIKTGGVNVFPAEVEAALISMPGIIDAAVIGLPDPDWSRALHAILVPADPLNPPAEIAIRAFLRERLTALKIPKTFEFVSTLGRAETMKLNRRKLTEERMG